MRIGGRDVGMGHPPFIIAEMSGNHNQSLDRALEIAARNPSARYWGVEVRPLMHEANVEP